MASRRTKTAAQEPDAVQFADPLAVGDIALAAGHVLEMPGVDEQHLEAARLEDLVDRDPVDAGGFHRHARHATGASASRPGAADRSVKVVNDCTGLRVAIGRHGDVMLGRAAVDPGDVRIDAI